MIQIVAERCVGCGACVPVCPNEAISLPATLVATIDQERCTGCEACVESCPSDAILVIDIIEPEPVALQMRAANPLTVQNTALPALIGSMLVWVGREFLPRLATIAIDKLTHHKEPSPPAVAAGTDTQHKTVSQKMGRGKGGRRKHHRQRRGPQQNV